MKAPFFRPARVRDNSKMNRFGLIFWQRNVMLVLCLLLPWLNPFAVSPSTAVIPLLLSWMMACCAVLAMSEEYCSPNQIPKLEKWLGLLWLCTLGVSLYAVPPVIDRAATLGLLGALAAIGLMVAVGRRIAEPHSGLWPYVAAAWLLAALINAALGVLQYLDLAQSLSPWVNQPFKGDAFGNLRQRNQFASLTCIGWVALWCWVVREQTTVQQRRLYQILVGLSMSLLAVGAACSMSRTGAIEWLVVPGLALMWLIQERRSGRAHSAQLWLLCIAAPVSVVVASVVMPALSLWITGDWGASLVLRVTGQAQSYAMCASRHVLWSNVLSMIAQQPWLGWGWAETDFAHFMTLYSDARFCDMLDNAHDLPLHLALEFGLIFAAVSLLFALAWIWRRQAWRETLPERLMAWGVLAVLLIHSLLEYPLWYGPFQMALGLCIGLLWQRPQHTDLKPVVSRQPVFLLSLACVLFLACLYTAWDFNRVGQIYKAPQMRDPAFSGDPLGYAKKSWIFKNQADFAELTLLTVTPDNAQHVYDLATGLMHYSPEDRVVQRLIQAADFLGKTDEAQQLRQRLQAAQDSQKQVHP